MNVTEETKSAAARFMDAHDRLQSDLSTALLTIEDQRKELEKADATIAIQRDALTQANADKNTYLQYSFELSAQLQFIVSGSARALMIAGQVRNKIALQASGIPPVPGADIAELEDIIKRIGQNNEAAKGEKPAAAVADEAPADRDETGTLVDRNGHPITPSDATKSMLPLAS